jgi:hypothetical protein
LFSLSSEYITECYNALIQALDPDRTIFTKIDAKGHDSQEEGAKLRKKPCKLGVESLSTLFHLPVKAACAKLGISTTSLKGLCRKNGLPRWPHRKVGSILKDL